MVEVSEEQRKLAQDYIKKEEEQKIKMAQNQDQLQVCSKEADQLIKYLNANGLKMRKSIFTEQITTKDGRKQDNSFAVEYFTGKFKLKFTSFRRRHPLHDSQ